MKIGIADYCAKDFDVFRTIQIAKKLKCNFIQITLNLYEFYKADQEKLEKLKEIVKEKGDIEVVFHPFIIEFSDENINKIINVMSALGSKIGVFHVPRNISIGLLNDIVARFKNKGMIFAAENIYPYQIYENKTGKDGKKHDYYWSIEDFKKLIKEVPEIKILLDVAHAHGSGINPADFYRAFRDKIVAFHISDPLGYSHHNPLGAGEIDFNAFFKVAKSDDKVFILEIEHMEDKIEESINKIRKGLNA